MDGFSLDIDNLVESWILSDMYHLKGLKFCCMSSLKLNWCEESDVSRILKESEDLTGPCDEMKRKYLGILEQIESKHSSRSRCFMGRGILTFDRDCFKFTLARDSPLSSTGR